MKSNSMCQQKFMGVLCVIKFEILNLSLSTDADHEHCLINFVNSFLKNNYNSYYYLHYLINTILTYLPQVGHLHFNNHAFIHLSTRLI